MQIAADIETTGLYPVPNSKIYCVAVNTSKSIAVHTDIKSLKPILEDKRIRKVIHNAAFDSFWLRMLYNIEVQNIWDTRIMEQIIIGENLPRSSKDEALKKELSSSLLYTLSRYGLAELENKSLGEAFATRDRNKPLTKEELDYAKNDVRYLLKLQKLQEQKLIESDLMRVAEMENKVVERIVNMRYVGIGFDENIWLKIAEANEKEYNKLMSRLPSVVDNWNSPIQVKKYFNSKGIPIESLTGIEEFAKTYNDKELHQFIQARSLYKNVTTYGKSWLQDDIKITTMDNDGRIRSDFEQVLNTGRLSSSHPNLQNIRAEGQHRAAFVPAKGKVFVIGDFSGQEIGIMAAASKEKIWIDAMLKKEDIHSLTASLLYPDVWKSGKEKQCAFPKKCKCEAHNKVRQHAKIINFAIAYGAGPQNIAAQLKISNNDAIRLLNRYKRVVPNLTRWLNSNSVFTIKTRTSFSADPFKRRRVLRDPEEWMLRNIGKNNPVQSSGANQTKLAMITLHKNAPLVLQVHDELILEVKKSEAKKWAKHLKETMEAAADYCTGIKGLITVEPRIATNLLKE